jgi:hypothetical protein
MKTLLFLTSALIFILTGCQSMPENAMQAASGAVGAYIGHEVSDGKPEGAVLGAATGAVASTAFNHWKDTGEKKAYATGYESGRSDEVKRLYWISKRLHEGDDSGGLGRGFYEIPVPEHVTKDGVIIEQHTQVVEVIEP